MKRASELILFVKWTAAVDKPVAVDTLKIYFECYNIKNLDFLTDITMLFQ